MTLIEFAQDHNSFCKINQTGEISLKQNHPYYFQIQGQLAITRRRWCDFVVWTLKKPLSVERIVCDPDLWEIMLAKLNKFYIQVVLPELFSLLVKRGISLYKNFPSAK